MICKQYDTNQQKSELYFFKYRTLKYTIETIKNHKNGCQESRIQNQESRILVKKLQEYNIKKHLQKRNEIYLKYN